MRLVSRNTFRTSNVKRAKPLCKANTPSTSPGLSTTLKGQNDLARETRVTSKRAGWDSMDGRRKKITSGAGSGMGLVTAKAFAEAGAAVALADVNENAVASAAEQLV